MQGKGEGGSRENILSVYTHRYIHRHQHIRVC